MKRILPIFLTLVLVFVLAVPVFASDFASDINNYPEYPVHEGKNYLHYTFNGQHSLTFYWKINSAKIDSMNTITVGVKDFVTYNLVDGAWVKSNESIYNSQCSITADAHLFSNSQQIFSTVDGSLLLDVCYRVPVTLECDGSACPANDVDHNNICDDCGMILTYNLRSTLLTYAMATAEGWAPDYPYYAVVEHVLSDSNPAYANTYVVYISEIPMYAQPPDYDTALGSGMRWFTVSEQEDGSFTHSGNSAISSWQGTVIYANHDMENFQRPPLAMVIQGVTEGELLRVTLPNLVKTIKILVLCGVGCLALLIVLRLFGKRSLISRN